MGATRIGAQCLAPPASFVSGVQHVDRLRRLRVPQAGKTAQVLAAIAAGDGALAQTCLRQHLSGTLSQIDEICERYPDDVVRD